MRASPDRRHGRRYLVPAAALLLASFHARSTDTYVAASGELQIPALRIGNATLANVVVTIGSIVSAPHGSAPLGDMDTYDPASNQLTAPAVQVGGRTYYNAVGRVASLVAVGSATGADTVDGATLHLPYLLVGSTAYYNVALAVSPADVVRVRGGMPAQPFDQYVAATGQLTVPVVQYGAGVYTNVVLNVGPREVQSVGVTASLVYSFGGVTGDGVNPNSGLMQASDGNLYGVTANGGANGTGAVIRLAPGGSVSELYSFQALGSHDGWGPSGALIQASDGNFYGTTLYGGANANCINGTGGCGTLFKVTPDGVESLVYSFGATANDAALPGTGVIQASDGNFYGTTGNGGANNVGTVFKVTPGGSETVLHTFGASANDGIDPGGRLVQASDGNLYGVTNLGGITGAAGSSGTVFRVTPAGDVQNFYQFAGGLSGDGTEPVGSLIQASDGNLYGATYGGGTDNSGTVFRVTLTGAESVVYAFGFGGDAANPNGSLIQASDGNIYGLAFSGGALNYGALYEVSLAGAETVVTSFLAPSATQGYYPVDIVQATDANLFVTFSGGGAYGSGGENNDGVVTRINW